MRLIDELNKLIADKPGLFREQLMREDVARLEKLEALARSTAEPESYRLAGRKLGWTSLDARTSELGGVLDELLEAVRETTLSWSVAADVRTVDAWRALAHLRMERLVGCLSTPLPKRAGEDSD